MQNVYPSLLLQSSRMKFNLDFTSTDTQCVFSSSVTEIRRRHHHREGVLQNLQHRLCHPQLSAKCPTRESERIANIWMRRPLKATEAQRVVCISLFAAVRRPAHADGFIKGQVHLSTQAAGVWERRPQPHGEGGRVCVLKTAERNLSLTFFCPDFCCFFVFFPHASTWVWDVQC